MAWHAKLSASNAKRWINCPGSVRAIQELYDSAPELKERDEASPYAKEGTAAHHLLEHCLTKGLPFLDPHVLVGGAVTAEGAVLGPDQVVRLMKDWHEVTEDMADAVGVAVDYVAEEMARLGPGCELHTERRCDLTWLHPDLGGTSDVTIDQFLVELVVLDYKHGRGVVVEVLDEGGHVNEQGMCYLLGAAKLSGFSHDRYTVGIIQPRAAHSDGPIRTASVSKRELLDFVKTLESAARRTEDPDAGLSAGDWCRFCPRSGNCPAQDRRASEQAGADFDGLPLEGQQLPVPTEDLAIKLAWVPVIDAWCRGVEATAQRLAEHGVAVPGYKLVRKKTNRKLRGEAELRAAVELAGLDPLKLYEPPKAKSPAKIEKLGKAYKALVNSKDPGTGEPVYVFKPEGAMTLVPETDPRPAVDPSAISDFTNLDEEEGIEE